jgi:hypothetical protein
MAEAPDCLFGSSAADVAEYITAGEEAVSRYVHDLDEYPCVSTSSETAA